MICINKECTNRCNKHAETAIEKGKTYSEKDFTDKCVMRPYSDKDYELAKQQGLDLNNWNDYKQFNKMEEYAETDDERYS